MKIGFVIGGISSGGIARATTTLANGLLALGHEVFILPHYFDESKTHQLDNKIKIIPLNFKKVSLRKVFSINKKKIRKIIIDNNLDVVISCGALFFMLGALATRKTKAYSIAWEHSNFFSKHGHFGKGLNRRLGVLLSNAAVVLTESDKLEYKRHYRKKNVFVIHNAVAKEFRESNRNYNSNTGKIITVGALNYFKNYEGLVEVGRKLFSLNKKFVWDIYGIGTLEEKIKGLISAYGLNNNIRLMGQNPQIHEVYNNYSLYVCTSRSEGLPMTLIEAKTLNLPIVSYDIKTGPSDIISDGINGYLIKFEDSNKMANIINELITNPKKLEMLSGNASIDINKFYLESIVEQWNKVFNKGVL